MNMIEIIEVINPQYAFPVMSVIVLAILVYAFGFQSVAPPPRFDFIEDGRKASSATKKRKPTKKPTQNGHAVTESYSSLTRQVKQGAQSSPRVAPGQKSPQKPKKEVAREPDVVPVDIDDGEWVQQISRKERKKRREECVIESGEGTRSGSPAVEEVVMRPRELTPKAKKRERRIIPEPIVAVVEEPKKVVKQKENVAVQTDDIECDDLEEYLASLEGVKQPEEKEAAVPETTDTAEREVKGTVKKKKRGEDETIEGDEATVTTTTTHQDTNLTTCTSTTTTTTVATIVQDNRLEAEEKPEERIIDAKQAQLAALEKKIIESKLKPDAEEFRMHEPWRPPGDRGFKKEVPKSNKPDKVVKPEETKLNKEGPKSQTEKSKSSKPTISNTAENSKREKQESNRSTKEFSNYQPVAEKSKQLQQELPSPSEESKQQDDFKQQQSFRDKNKKAMQEPKLVKKNSDTNRVSETSASSTEVNVDSTKSAHSDKVSFSEMGGDIPETKLKKKRPRRDQ